MQRSPALTLWLRTLRYHSCSSGTVPGLEVAATLPGRAQHSSSAEEGPQSRSSASLRPLQPNSLPEEAPQRQRQLRPSSGEDLHWNHAVAHGDLPGDEALSPTLQILRRHNTSLPILEGQMILCRVLSVSRQALLLNTGTGTTRVLNSQILPTQLVQSSRTDTSPRQSPADFRMGDLIKIRLEDIMSPYGDAVLETFAAAKSPSVDEVLAELARAHELRRPVMGRVLNSVFGGFSVGFSGVVCFCPHSRMDPRTAARIGVLQPFSVIDFTHRDAIVSDLTRASVWDVKTPSRNAKPLWKQR